MKRVLVLPFLATALLAATWSFGHFDVRPEQLERNEERWASLSSSERAALRERWTELRLAMRDGAEGADLLRRRLGTLNRMLQQEGERSASGMSAAELEARLESLPSRIQLHLGLAPEMHWEANELVAMLRADTRRRMDAFLGNLSHEGLMHDDTLAAFYLADWDSKVEQALDLLKREALFFEAELPLEELSEMSPLDLAARQDEQRRRRGLIGRAGRLLDLSEEEARRLDSLSDDEFEQAFGEVVRPAARRLLLAQGVPAETVDTLVALPYRSLERTMERLLLARR